MGRCVLWGGSACILDDTNQLGFSADIALTGQVNISVIPLSGTTATPAPYISNLPVKAPIIGILPIPSGVGIVYTDTVNTGFYAFDNAANGSAFSGTTTVHLISYVWDKTTSVWSEQASQLALPQYTMSVMNTMCPNTTMKGCSGPLLYFPVPYAVPAYYTPVVYQNAVYDYGGAKVLPGFQSDIVFGGNLWDNLTFSWVVVSMKNAQLMVGSSGVFSIPLDAAGNIIPTPLIVGVPGYIHLNSHRGDYWVSAGNFFRNNVGVTTQ